MLVGFSVGNYKSYKNVQTISFVASKVSRHQNHIYTSKNRKLLKGSLIYGANASGKSNLIDAVYFSKNIIIKGLDDLDLNKKYFKLGEDKNYYKEPGIFEYRMIIKDIEYSYGFAISYCNQEIIAEWLVENLPNGEEKIVFNREMNENGFSNITEFKKYDTDTENNKFKFYLDDFSNNISNSLRKKTILSDIASRVSSSSNYFQDIINVYNYFEKIIVIFPDSKYGDICDFISDIKKKNIFELFLKHFDTGIVSIDQSKEVFDIDKLLSNINDLNKEQFRQYIFNNISKEPIMLTINDRIVMLSKDETGDIVYSKLQLNHGKSNELFNFNEESDGTKRLFDLIPIFFIPWENRVIFIDEIDRSMHTNLIKNFLELYYNLTEDDKFQLIATTHDSNLLDLELMRQDEIWFVERENDKSSTLYSLNKFKERYDKKIEKEYLIGRYGAIPIFQSLNLEGLLNE